MAFIAERAIDVLVVRHCALSQSGRIDVPFGLGLQIVVGWLVGWLVGGWVDWLVDRVRHFWLG